jgi:hypothetical protein
MTSDARQGTTLDAIVRRLRPRAARLVRDVAADLGDADPDLVPVTVLRFLDMITGGAGLGDADRLRLRQEGSAAARIGRPLAAPMDAYLSTAWVTWDHALDLEPPLDVPAMRELGATLLRAGDDIAAALSDGYTAAERALATTAGAARQAILEELVTRPPTDPAAVARLLRGAALGGLDPAMEHHLLLLRPSAESDHGELVEALARRLARDPARRSHLVAARGPDIVALAGGPWREGRPFEEATAGLTAEPWWAVVAGPIGLEDTARAYADAVDASRVAPAVSPMHIVVPVAGLALERALVADPVLAAAGVDRWLSPLLGAPRGGGDLVRTLEAWLASGRSITATARVLRVAPRTVSYRLDRVARLLGVRALDPDTVSRLSAAMLVARLLGRDRVASTW